MERSWLMSVLMPNVACQWKEVTEHNPEFLRVCCANFLEHTTRNGKTSQTYFSRRAKQQENPTFAAHFELFKNPVFLHLADSRSSTLTVLLPVFGLPSQKHGNKFWELFGKLCCVEKLHHMLMIHSLCVQQKCSTHLLIPSRFPFSLFLFSFFSKGIMQTNLAVLRKKTETI